MMIPNMWSPSIGKLVFVMFDILAGQLIYCILRCNIKFFTTNYNIKYSDRQTPTISLIQSYQIGGHGLRGYVSTGSMRMAAQSPGDECLDAGQCRVGHCCPGLAHYPPVPAEGLPAHRPDIRAGHPPQDLPPHLLPLPLRTPHSEVWTHIPI